MSVHSRFGHAIARGALSFSLAAGALMFAGGALAQTAPVALNAPPANLSNHDAAIEAAHRGDYVAALDFAKKAAADKQPIDPDQLDYITGKAAKQQADLDAAAAAKAAQATAQETAAQIQARQQKDYADRQKAAERKARFAADDEPSAAKQAEMSVAMGAFANESGNAQGQSQPHSSEFKTAANAVNSTPFAQERPLMVNNGAKSSDGCLTVEPTGAQVFATNKCAYKVVFVWCAYGLKGGQACPAADGVPTFGRGEIDANGRVAISDLDGSLVQGQGGYQWVSGLKVHTWVCRAPLNPTTTSPVSYECR